VNTLDCETLDRVPPERPPDKPEDDRDGDEAPETPPTEPEPAPVEEPPDAPGPRGPYVVDGIRGVRLRVGSAVIT
jgi:hypothetical protein